eukprot:364015-Pelagomonas_calceolata.AAC.3
MSLLMPCLFASAGMRGCLELHPLPPASNFLFYTASVDPTAALPSGAGYAQTDAWFCVSSAYECYVSIQLYESPRTEEYPLMIASRVTG